eukprot:TRINITY_DN883_c1_g1_i1.p1 TRINITY_DN883_c1_g1~~TRINITY_DN883_c1_g1_i1.p1  ORF type:complete len:649 (+),score=132.45 TRINITY_DN883_c1_g1_i1:43-1947(+)
MAAVTLYDDCEALPQYSEHTFACGAGTRVVGGAAAGVAVALSLSPRSTGRPALREVAREGNQSVTPTRPKDCTPAHGTPSLRWTDDAGTLTTGTPQDSLCHTTMTLGDLQGLTLSSLTPDTLSETTTQRQDSVAREDNGTVAEDVWENERWMVLRGWGMPAAVERAHHSDKSGARVRIKDAVLLPAGWDWTGEWLVDLSTVANGWHYASDFTTSVSRCREQAGKTDLVRRRRWRRVRVPVSQEALRHKVVAGRTGGRYWAACESYGFVSPMYPPPASYRRDAQKRNHVATAMWKSTFQNKAYDRVLAYGEKARLRGLIRKHFVPSHLRGRVWADISGATRKKRENHGYYKCVIESLREDMPWDRELDKDLPRTFADHPYFAAPDCPGRMKLRRVLRALSYRNPLVNYCQSFNFIAACMLLNAGEETTFWLLISLLEDTLPNDYYNAHLVGITVDVRVLGDLIDMYCSGLAKHFRAHQLDITPFMAGWVMNLYVGVFPIDVAMKIWDILFCEGPKIMFRVVIGMLRLFEHALLKMESLGEVLEYITDACKRMYDPSDLLREGLAVRLADTRLTKLRESHRADVQKEVEMRNLISRTESLSPGEELDADLHFTNVNDSWVSLDGFLSDADDVVCGS